jgi:6-phosphogluconate dehydrogenase
MNANEYDIGMVGLGVMGRNLVLNIADRGFAVSGYDKDESKTAALAREAGDRKVAGAKSLNEFVQSLRSPRAIMFLVPAGAPVDSVIRDLLPHLQAGDLLIDGGNSHFRDTERRGEELKGKKILFMGMGVSGGERGARLGPSMMPGGQKEAYSRVADLLEKAAAKVDGDPCVTWLGHRSAGHYVKMVHNGIEYGLMQLLAETYDLMKRGLGSGNDELHEVYAEWNDGDLRSYLVEITAKVLLQKDDRSDQRLIDVVLDKAKQKGTGKWTSQDAMDLQVPVPTIDTAVAMRDLSGYKKEREEASTVLSGPAAELSAEKSKVLVDLKNAFHFAMIVTYAQGMSLLSKADEVYEYGLVLENVARIWRGGCIIRSDFLEDIRRAYRQQPDLSNLMVDADISRMLANKQYHLRRTISLAVAAGVPVPGMSASLGYYDGFRSARLPANLTQAQRDFFGAHTYERIDREGSFHTKWIQE